MFALRLVWGGLAKGSNGKLSDTITRTPRVKLTMSLLLWFLMELVSGGSGGGGGGKATEVNGNKCWVGFRFWVRRCRRRYWRQFNCDLLNIVGIVKESYIHRLLLARQIMQLIELTSNYHIWKQLGCLGLLFEILFEWHSLTILANWPYKHCSLSYIDYIGYSHIVLSITNSIYNQLNEF